METYGFIDHELRGVLRTVAERHIDQSVTDIGLSDGERKSLLGVTLNRMYVTLSVNHQIGVVRQLRTAARAVSDHVLAAKGVDLRRRAGRRPAGRPAAQSNMIIDILNAQRWSRASERA